MISGQALLGVDYDEFHPETFRAFTVHLDGVEKRFPSFDEALTYAEDNAESVIYMSSLDNFVADQNRPTRH